MGSSGGSDSDTADKSFFESNNSARSVLVEKFVAREKESNNSR